MFVVGADSHSRSDEEASGEHEIHPGKDVAELSSEQIDNLLQVSNIVFRQSTKCCAWLHIENMFYLHVECGEISLYPGKSLSEKYQLVAISISKILVIGYWQFSHIGPYLVGKGKGKQRAKLNKVAIKFYLQI